MRWVLAQKRTRITLALAMVTTVAGLLATGVVQAQKPAATSDPHANMARDEGVWDAEMQLWMAPGMQPMASKAVETNKMFGKYWMISQFESDMGAVKYLGRGQHGYDPVKKKYVGTWIDSMTPYLSTMEGDYDVETHTLTMMSTGRNPMTGEVEKSKMINKFIDENTKTFQIYKQLPAKEGEAATDEAGKWWKTMEISYKRRK